MTVQESTAALFLLIFTTISRLDVLSVLYLDSHSKTVSDLVVDNIILCRHDAIFVCVYTGSSRSVTFRNILPRDERNTPYSLRVVAMNTDGVEDNCQNFCPSWWIGRLGIIVHSNLPLTSQISIMFYRKSTQVLGRGLRKIEAMIELVQE